MRLFLQRMHGLDAFVAELRLGTLIESRLQLQALLSAAAAIARGAKRVQTRGASARLVLVQTAQEGVCRENQLTLLHVSGCCGILKLNSPVPSAAKGIWGPLTSGLYFEVSCGLYWDEMSAIKNKNEL